MYTAENWNVSLVFFHIISTVQI